MNRSKFKIGAFLFTFAMTAGLLVPFSVSGQGGGIDGFIGVENEFDERDLNWLVGIILNDSFGAPVGSGIGIMLAAGAAYGVVKRRRAKVSGNLGIIMLGSVMILLMTQCKKSEVTAQIPDDQIVEISVAISANSKVDVDVLSGVVTFEDGDELLVANSGIYKGKLIYSNGSFTGGIRPSSSSDYLHFYYIGNLPVDNLIVGGTTSITFFIKDQIRKLPVISYGHSTAKFHGAGKYRAVLENKCSLVKLNVTASSRFASTVLHGMQNKVTIDFAKKDADDAITTTKDDNGGINLPPGSGERWAILMPQKMLYMGGTKSVISGRYVGRRPVFPAISADEHLTDGIDISATSPYKPGGISEGLFTVDSEGNQVYIGIGNCYTVHEYGWWNFYGASYDSGFTSDQIVEENQADVEYVTLFGWGASGFNDGANEYLPGSTSTVNTDYNPYGSLDTDLRSDNGRADWGYNNNQVASFMYDQWRTPTADEWEYIFTSRTDAAEKFSYATICGVPGLLLLPDVWTKPNTITFTPGITNSFTENVYDQNDWTDLRYAGAVFMPCTGYREGTNVVHVREKAYYWSSTHCDDERAYALRIDAELGFSPKVAIPRSTGAAVRMVTE